jgi:hypothetical protein
MPGGLAVASQMLVRNVGILVCQRGRNRPVEDLLDHWGAGDDLGLRTLVGHVSAHVDDARSGR